jgi:hypothetical protein
MTFISGYRDQLGDALVHQITAESSGSDDRRKAARDFRCTFLLAEIKELLFLPILHVCPNPMPHAPSSHDCAARLPSPSQRFFGEQRSLCGVLSEGGKHPRPYSYRWDLNHFLQVAAVVPQFAVQRVPEHKVVKLVQTRWQEHVLQKHLYTHDAVEKRGIWPALQQRLCEATLERAKLEVDLYNQALFGSAGCSTDCCKLRRILSVTPPPTSCVADLRRNSSSSSAGSSASLTLDPMDSPYSDCDSDLDLEECGAFSPHVAV